MAPLTEPIVRAFWAALEQDMNSRLEDFLTDDYVRHSLHADMSRDEFLMVIRERARAFPDLRATILDVVENGDKIAYRWESEGTHLGTFMNVPATKRKVKARGITISRISNGQIAEDWSSWQTVDVLHSMNVFPI